jgi:hypothetical protein
LRIKGLNIEEKTAISIIDIQGNQMLEATVSNGTSSINVRQLPTGVYLLKIKSENNITTLKFIKE